MGRDRVEIGPKRRKVHGLMPRGLGAVHHHHSAGRPGFGRNARQGRLTESQHVGLLAQRHELGFLLGEGRPGLLVKQPLGGKG